MPRKIAVSTLNASTIDILNVIRQNAGYEYQSQVPKVEKATDIPKVGEIIYGSPALSNAFINALVNRIAVVRVQSATFNNPYRRLKKGYVEFGETIEDIFVNIAKVVRLDVEKADEREFKRTIPDIKSAFYAINWKTLYPVTISDSDLKQAFLSLQGVTNLIARIVEQVYTGAEYDEFLLFKYMIIKAISHGQIKVINVGTDPDLEEAATSFRGYSNLMTFMRTEFNESGVLNNAPRSRQVIFMDSMYNARFDVVRLSAAFNMDKTTFMGSLFLIDDWTTFDNKRFLEIQETSDMMEPVTTEELAIMKNVVAFAADEEWFQVYDNKNKFAEKYVASCDYWNYFYHVWKTVAHSPFANAIAFVSLEQPVEDPETVNVEITSKDISEHATVFGLNAEKDAAGLQPDSARFIQTEAATKAGIAIQEYGALMIPGSATGTPVTLQANVGNSTYTATSELNSVSDVGETITLNKDGVVRSKTRSTK